MEWTKGEFRISDVRADLDVNVIHGFLATSYWAEGIPRTVVEEAIANSVCFGLFEGMTQIGFARVITDCATFGYLADVFVLPEFRGRGLSKWLVACIQAHPRLQGFRRWMLATRDAHGLYRQFGFRPLAQADRWMEIADPDIYRRGREA